MLEQTIRACFGRTSGEVNLQSDDADLTSRDPEAIGAFAGDDVVVFSLITTDGECVGLAAEDRPAGSPEPSFAMTKGERRVSVWLLDKPAGSGDRLNHLVRVFSPEDDQIFVPLPGTGGWTIEGPLDDVRRVSLDDLSADPYEAPDRVARLNDAFIHGELDEEFLAKDISYGYSVKGAATANNGWKVMTSPIGTLINFLSKHVEGQKDGPCILQGVPIDGVRHSQSMAYQSLMIFDLDTGQSMEEIDSRLRKKGIFFIRYTTHSSGKALSTVKKDAFLKWSDKAEPTAFLVGRYLVQERGYQPEIVDGAELMPTEHQKEGLMLTLRHKPMPKFRIVLVLKEPFVFAERGSSHKEAIQEWKESYAGEATEIGAFYDKSCVDPSRLMYTPRHEKGAEFQIDVFAGRPLDLNEVPRVDIRRGAQDDNPWDAAGSALGGGGGSKQYKTPGLLKLFARDGDIIELDTLMLAKDQEGDRGSRTGGPGRVHRCPNDDAHSDPGNPEDRGFFVINGTDSAVGAVAKCMHSSCADLDRIDLIDLFCVEHGIDHAQDLKEFVPEIEGRGEEEPSETVYGTRNRPEIQVASGRLSEMATEAEEAILGSGVALYQRGADLVRPAQRELPASKGRMTTAAVLDRIGVPALRDIYSSVADWSRFDARSKDLRPTDPPKDVASTHLSRFGSWRHPVVSGIITTPTLRPDGSVLSTPGYDAATRMHLIADPYLRLPSMPDCPARSDAERALGLLDELLVGFPFVSDADRAVALAGLITPVVRGAMPVAPLFAIRATAPGSGKSYLVDVAGVIATGREAPAISAGASTEEMEKRLGGLLLDGATMITLDNVNGEIGGDLLCQAVERPLIRVRRLGGSDVTDIESRSTLFATGNGLRVRGDMVRRTLLCSLDAGVERPELREHASDPVRRVVENRGEYVAAAMVIVRAFRRSGAPVLPAIASFAAWSDMVRSALVWLGCADPCLTMETAREEDPELDDVRDVMAAWRACVGCEPVSLRAVVDLGQRRDVDPFGDRGPLCHPDLYDALTRVCATGPALSTKRLGYWLRGKAGRIVGVDGAKLRFVRGAKAHDNVGSWRIEELGRG